MATWFVSLKLLWHVPKVLWPFAMSLWSCCLLEWLLLWQGAGLALTFKITLIQAAISHFVIKWGKFCNLVHSVCDNTANCLTVYIAENCKSVARIPKIWNRKTGILPQTEMWLLQDRDLTLIWLRCQDTLVLYRNIISWDKLIDCHMPQFP